MPSSGDTSKRLTGAEAARQIGISRQVFHRQAKAGVYVAGADGRYDLDDCLRRRDEMLSRHNGGKHPPKGPGLEQQVRSTLDADGMAYETGSSGVIPLVEVQRLNELYKLRRAQIDLAERTEELVDRVTVRQKINQLATSERESWRTWPADVSTKLAADLGVDETRLRVLLQGALDERLATLRAVVVNL